MDNQGGIKKILSSKITLFFLLLAFIWLAVNLVDVYYKKYKITQSANALKVEIEKAQKDNQQISAMIEYLGSASFLEKQAREKLNMKKEGENVVILEPSDNTSSSVENSLAPIVQETSPAEQKTSSVPGVSSIQEQSNLVKWWKYFFK